MPRKKQHPDPRHTKSIGRRIYVLHRWHQEYIDRELAPLGIGSGQFQFLHSLYSGDGISQEQLTEMVGVDKATTARAVRKLMDLGFVRRERDPDDHRAYRIYLTPKGRKARVPIRRALKGWTIEATAQLDGKETETLRQLLDRMVDRAPGRHESEAEK